MQARPEISLTSDRSVPPLSLDARAWWLATLNDIASDPASSNEISSDNGIDLTARTVLICEDEPLIAYDIASGIEDAGGTVVGPFAAVADAMAALDEAKPDYATLDVNLLDGDVTPVLLRLAEAGVPMVVNTGTKLPEVANDLQVPVFIKPTEPGELIAALARA